MTAAYTVGFISGAIAGITFSMILLALIFKPFDPWEMKDD